jgi:two-component system OmpR family response regulator
MKVLLIDDEEDIRSIGQLSLEAVGKFQAMLAASAAEGIELALASRPDLILMDMMMPGTDGLAALLEIRRTPSLDGVPVVFLTAKAQRSDVARYLEMGAAGVICKPFDPMTLPLEIRRVLAGAAKE